MSSTSQHWITRPDDVRCNFPPFRRERMDQGWIKLASYIKKSKLSESAPSSARLTRLTIARIQWVPESFEAHPRSLLSSPLAQNSNHILAPVKGSLIIDHQGHVWLTVLHNWGPLYVEVRRFRVLIWTWISCQPVNNRIHNHKNNLFTTLRLQAHVDRHLVI